MLLVHSSAMALSEEEKKRGVFCHKTSFGLWNPERRMFTRMRRDQAVQKAPILTAEQMLLPNPLGLPFNPSAYIEEHGMDGLRRFASDPRTAPQQTVDAPSAVPCATTNSPRVPLSPLMSSTSGQATSGQRNVSSPDSLDKLFSGVEGGGVTASLLFSACKSIKKSMKRGNKENLDAIEGLGDHLTETGDVLHDHITDIGDANLAATEGLGDHLTETGDVLYDHITDVGDANLAAAEVRSHTVTAAARPHRHPYPHPHPHPHPHPQLQSQPQPQPQPQTHTHTAPPTHPPPYEATRFRTLDPCEHS